MDRARWAPLIEAAMAARENAHAPYSKYRVGAAILTRSGRVFTGCNVENASYGGAICAERTAITKMVSEGERHPVACVVVTAAPAGTPCGFCRQVMVEFTRDMPILLVGVDARGKRTQRRTSLKKLLPDAFVPDTLTVALGSAPRRGAKRGSSG
jgi:cytidine deaminase